MNYIPFPVQPAQPYPPYPMYGWNDGLLGGGGGGLAALLALGLLGRRDDGRVGEGCVTPATLSAGLAGVTASNNISTVLAQLANIQGAIPLAEAQVQLALAGATGNIMSQANTNATAQALADANIVKTVTDASGVNLVATLNSKFDLATIINNDGEKTRNLINNTNLATLNRELAVAQSALIEERGFRRTRESEINITNTNTNTNAQGQVQAQLQAQSQVLAGIVPFLQNLANDIQVVRQTQSNINFGVQAGTTQGQAATNNRVS